MRCNGTLYCPGSSQELSPPDGTHTFGSLIFPVRTTQSEHWPALVCVLPGIKSNKTRRTTLRGTSSWLGATKALLTASLSALTSSSSSSSSLGCCWLLSFLGEILKTHPIWLRILFFYLCSPQMTVLHSRNTSCTVPQKKKIEIG